MATEPTWGDHLLSTEVYGREADPKMYVEIKDRELYRGEEYRHAAHVLFYAPISKVALEHYNRKALVLMQMRFDGYIGFPGGLVDEGEAPHEGATRELVEELAYDPKKYGPITEEDYAHAFCYEPTKLVCHLYIRRLSEADIHSLILKSPEAKEFGDESLGLILVPLYTMGDTIRGFPSFLKHNFIGCARQQLTKSLILLNILTKEEVDAAFKAIETKN